MVDINENVAPAPVAPQTVSGGKIGLAIGAGLGAALVGAGIWAAVTVATNYELGIMAVAVGFIVGKAIMAVAPSRSAMLGIVGALCSLVGCALGNLFSAVGFFAQANTISYFDALGHLDGDLVVRLMTATFRPMDLIFYGIGIYEGYRFSFRK